MNFYVIANGFIGSGYVRIYIVAPSDERAIELARDAFKAEAGSHGEEYYRNLAIEYKLSSDGESVSEIDE